MLNRLLISFLVCCSGVVHSNTPIGERSVSKLMFHDSGNLYVYFTGTPSHGEPCEHKEIYVLPHDNHFFSEIYSGLLAAMHARTPVSGYVDGCVDIWGKTKTKITRIDLVPSQ